MAGRKGDYLFKRKGSENWHIRLQYPGSMWPEFGKKTEKSLGTPDKAKAIILAAPLIAEHKQALYLHNLAKRVAAEGDLQSNEAVLEAMIRRIFLTGGSLKPVFPVGLNPSPEGGKIFATETEVHHMDASGKLMKTEPNEIEVRIPYSVFTEPEARELKIATAAANKVLKVDADSKIIDLWVKRKNVDPRFAEEARGVLAIFKSLTNGKTFANAEWSDGHALAEHFFNLGLKTATVEKKVAFLRSACNVAIKAGKLKNSNPFSGVVDKRGDAEKRPKFNDDDMAKLMEHLHELSDEDQLLFRWIASTGMRLSEPFQITGEELDRSQQYLAGVRYVTVGTKTEASTRNVPIPDAVLELLPGKITGPLFSDCSKPAIAAASKRLNRWIDRCGIADKGKVVHSFRHRAKDRLRAEGCPLDLQYEILGHEEKTVAAGYGNGSPMWVLKPWVDRIGLRDPHLPPLLLPRELPVLSDTIKT